MSRRTLGCRAASARPSHAVASNLPLARAARFGARGRAPQRLLTRWSDIWRPPDGARPHGEPIRAVPFPWADHPRRRFLGVGVHRLQVRAHPALPAASWPRPGFAACSCDASKRRAAPSRFANFRPPVSKCRLCDLQLRALRPLQPQCRGYELSRREVPAIDLLQDDLATIDLTKASFDTCNIALPIFPDCSCRIASSGRASARRRRSSIPTSAMPRCSDAPSIVSNGNAPG